MDWCVCESESGEHEYGVGTGVNVIIISDVLYGLNRSHRMCLLCIRDPC